MDYKEKYEQLEKFIKDLYPHMSDYCKEKTEGMIPELKESEDERIRKEILNVFKQLDECTTIFGRNYDYTKWIAWLEKQGEVKPEIKYIYPKFRVGDVIEPAEPNGSHIPVRVKYIGYGSYSCESEDHNAFLSLPIFNENKYVLAKQKSAEWSEEDENLLNLSLENLTELKNRFGEKYGKVGDCIGWLKSLIQRVHPQPKQEWSKEDETCLGNVLWAIEQARPIAKKENVLKNLRHAEKWLKDRVQPQNK